MCDCIAIVKQCVQTEQQRRRTEKVKWILVVEMLECHTSGRGTEGGRIAPTESCGAHWNHVFPPELPSDAERCSVPGSAVRC